MKKKRATSKPEGFSNDPVFLLGIVMITLHALDLLDSHGLKPGPFLSRHERCDFGDLSADAFKANRQAILSGGRVMSVYNIGPSIYDRIWIISDGLTTLIILPGEG